MAGNRTIIGSENSDDRHVELDKAVQNNKVTVPVTIYDGSGNQVNVPSGLVPNAYTSMSLSYNTNGNLINVIYLNGTSIVATLILAYDTNSNLVTVTKT